MKSLPQFDFKTAVDRSVIFSLDAEVVLRGDAPFGVVGVFITGAVAEAFGAGIVSILQMSRYRDESPFADVAAGLADGDGGSV